MNRSEGAKKLGPLRKTAQISYWMSCPFKFYQCFFVVYWNLLLHTCLSIQSFQSFNIFSDIDKWSQRQRTSLRIDFHFETRIWNENGVGLWSSCLKVQLLLKFLCSSIRGTNEIFGMKRSIANHYRIGEMNYQSFQYSNHTKRCKC